MPYSITTQDGITIDNIPDGIAPDSSELRRRVADIRASTGVATSSGSSSVSQIPTDAPGGSAFVVNARARAKGEPVAQAQEEGIGQKLLGAGEAALTLGTGATSGAVGGALGLVEGIARSIGRGKFGTQEGVRLAEEAALQGMQAGTYAPRTASGQRQVGAIAETLEPLQALGPAGVGPQVVGRAVRNIPVAAKMAAPGVATALQGGAAAVRQAAAPAARVAQAVKGAIKKVTPAKEVVAPIKTREEIIALSDRASGGIGSTKAREELAELSKIDKTAKEAVDRLDIDLPLDVFADNEQVRAAAGLARSVAASDSESAWYTTVRDAVGKVDDIIKTYDAEYVEGTPSTAFISQKIKDSLTSTRSYLDIEADKLYKNVDALVPKSSQIQLSRLKTTLADISKDVGENGMSQPEKKLLSMMENEAPTYGRLIREKSLIGNALRGKESPYGGMEEGSLKRLYGALAEDQLENVGRIAGEDARKQLRSANLLTAQRKGLEKRIIESFGKDLEGGIGQSIKTSLKSAAEGDAARFNRMFKTIPDEYKKQAISTALASLVRGQGADKTKFGITQFEAIYPKLRANPDVYSKIVKSLGEGSDQMLRDIYTFSKLTQRAEENILRTGKANQAIQGLEKTDNFLKRLFGNSKVRAALVGASGAAGGFSGLGVGMTIDALLGRRKSAAIENAGRVFSSIEFRDLIEKTIANPQAVQPAVKKMARSLPFRRYAESIKLPQDVEAYEKWILQSLQQTPKKIENDQQIENLEEVQ